MSFLRRAFRYLQEKDPVGTALKRDLGRVVTGIQEMFSWEALEKKLQPPELVLLSNFKDPEWVKGFRVEVERGTNNNSILEFIAKENHEHLLNQKMEVTNSLGLTAQLDSLKEILFFLLLKMQRTLDLMHSHALQYFSPSFP